MTGFVLFLLVVIAMLLRQIMSSRTSEGPLVSQERYNHETRYMEYLIFHIAFAEGYASKKRLFERIPEMETCSRCKRNLNFILEANRLKKDFVVEVKTDRWYLTQHTKRVVENAHYFYYTLGLSFHLPRSKMRFTHGACHIFEAYSEPKISAHQMRDPPSAA